MRGLIRALALVVASDSAIVQLLDPLGRMVDSITEGNVEVRYSPIVLNITVRGFFECVFVVLDMVVKPSDLFFEAAYLAGSMGFMLSNG